MPIPLTKFNKYTQLHIDLSNNSRLYNNYIYTCDISDTLVYTYDAFDGFQPFDRRRYLNSRAEYLMHPFSICSNSVNKFNNEKPIYKQKSLLDSRCYTTDADTCIDNVSNQKIIQNQVRVPSNLYTMNIATLTAANDTNTTIQKHDSYQRYLARKKGNNLKTDTNIVNPIKGNKDRKYGIGQCTC